MNEIKNDESYLWDGKGEPDADVARLQDQLARSQAPV